MEMESRVWCVCNDTCCVRYDESSMPGARLRCVGKGKQEIYNKVDPGK